MSSAIDRLGWAEAEVKRQLRGGVRHLSLHDWSTEQPWLQHASHQVLLDEGPVAAVKDSNPQRLDSRIEPKKRGTARSAFARVVRWKVPYVAPYRPHEASVGYTPDASAYFVAAAAATLP